MGRLKQHFFEEIAGREDTPDPHPDLGPFVVTLFFPHEPSRVYGPFHSEEQAEAWLLSLPAFSGEQEFDPETAQAAVTHELRKPVHGSL